MASMLRTRESCGYLTGLLLHRVLREPVCITCQKTGLRTADGWPEDAPAGEAAAKERRRRPTLNNTSPAAKGPGKKGDYGFPSID
jgi:hypothetical protein